MTCVKCGKPLVGTRCKNCDYEHRNDRVRLLAKPEDAELTVSWEAADTEQLRTLIRKKEQELKRLRELLKKRLEEYPETIKSFKDYNQVLKHLYLENGKRLLSEEQIKEFLEKYQLQSRYGIQAWDVRVDLRRISEENP